MDLRSRLEKYAAPAHVLSEIPTATNKDSFDRANFANWLQTHPFLMAPMAGVSDAAYRTMARAGGADLAYSEMVSCAGVHYGSENSWQLVDPADTEPRLAVQLFGSSPELFSEAAAVITERLGEKLALFDINMACPVKKVTKKGEGSALLDDPAAAARALEAVCSATNVPVTVKIRRGRKLGSECAAEFARHMEAAGASAIAVHGRFAEQFYSGEADWSTIDRVAAAVSIPVIGSGDVKTPFDAVRMLKTTAASAVMIARGSYGNPWIFSDAKHILALGVDDMYLSLDPACDTNAGADARGVTSFQHTSTEKLHAFICHIQLLHESQIHMKRARSLAQWYCKGLPAASMWRKEAMACSTLDEFMCFATRVLAQLEEMEADQKEQSEQTGQPEQITQMEQHIPAQTQDPYRRHKKVHAL